MRETYGLGELLESQVDADPIVQFGKWLEQARRGRHRRAERDGDRHRRR